MSNKDVPGRLELAVRHVVGGRRIVTAQEELVAEIKEKGGDPSFAESLLDSFRQTQAAFEADLRDLTASAHPDGGPPGTAPVLPHQTPDWTVGRRVSRPDGRDNGTIIGTRAGIKVRWDSGRTSHFRRGRQGNVVLDPVKR